MIAAPQARLRSGLKSCAAFADGPPMRMPPALRTRETHGRWPWVAATAAAPSAAVAYAARDWLKQDGRWALWLPLPVLFCHQTEEWVVPGGFLPWFNREVAGSGEDEFPITRPLGCFINTQIGWTLTLLGAVLGRRHPALATVVLSMDVGNAALHGGQFVRAKAYNPGAVTGVLVMLPLGIAGIVRLLRDPELDTRQLLRGVAIGTAGSVAMMAVMQARLRLRGRR